MLDEQLGVVSSAIKTGLNRFVPAFEPREVGQLVSVNNSVATISGLPRVRAQELVRFDGGELGIAFDLGEHDIGVVLLANGASLKAGVPVRRTGRVLDAPVGYGLLGRVINPHGQALDGMGELSVSQHWPVEREAPPIIDRDPVTTPLETGIKVIDALVPIGRGQRELILGDRQTGKTAVALDAIINQRGKGTICIYCAIGQRSASVARVIQTLKAHQVLAKSIVVVASGTHGPGLQYITPYAATSMAEYFMADGQDVLLVYDDLTRHARAYRELSLLLRRAPGREAFPGDIFYIHSRLLERATHLCPRRGGGSLTALPIIETEAGNMAAYIPTNLISITDGQIYLCPERFSKGQLPAIDVGRSVSRVGGKTQLPAYRAVTGDLRLAYAQFEELEAFARFGTRLDDQTRTAIDRGRRVREVLKQGEHQVLSSAEQIVTLLAVNNGRFDALLLSRVPEAQQVLLSALRVQEPDFCQHIADGAALDQARVQAILGLVDRVLDQAGLLAPQEQT